MVANLPPPVKPRTSKKNLFLDYEPAAYAELISPTPLLLVVALGDHLTVADQALAAYERGAMVVEVDRKVPTLRTVTPGRALLIPDQEPPAAERW